MLREILAYMAAVIDDWHDVKDQETAGPYVDSASYLTASFGEPATNCAATKAEMADLISLGR